jgi:sialic acid synthase SpsE|tara:strand:- start:565 stop:1644 length:1080 start_codon:yes stop_codon:yes gene_type:complete
MTLNIKNNKVYLIAEIGVNHNGILSLAKKLIKYAKKCGADAVKFQNFKAEKLVIRNAKKAPYQIKNTNNTETQYKMLKKLELKEKDYFLLKKYAQKLKIEFISSVFDEESIDFLNKKLKSKIIKIPSGEITNYLILKKLNVFKYKVLLSTGMSNYIDIIKAINIISKNKVYELRKGKVFITNKKIYKKLRKNLYLLHAVTDYPLKDKYANLNCIGQFIKDFKLVTGYSDHTSGILASLISVAKGAKIIEKHFTLNKNMKGPDHSASLNPNEFEKMAESLRKFEIMCGSGKKKLQKCELENVKISRKSIVAKVLIKKNQKFTYKNLTTKRPGTGLNPFLIEKLINKTSKKRYFPDEQIKI